MEQKISLTPEERKKPYAKYFDHTLAAPSQEALETMEKPIDPSKALLPENLNDLLNPGYLPCEAGWCVMPNGTGYVSNYTKMPGVTVEMVNWWFAWHALEPLRYKIWYPGYHVDLQISEEDRKKILNPNVPIEEKHYGVTHNVIEDIGGGAPDRIQINFKSPEAYGFDMARYKEGNVGALLAGVGLVKSTKSPFFVPAVPTMMCHMIREIPEGIEWRTRFWMGYNIVDGKPKKKLPSFAKVPAKVPNGLAVHNVHEYANFAAFLPQLFEEQKGIIA